MRTLVWDQIPLWGTQLIEASAGTGKTYTLTTLILRLLIERNLRIEEILVVTFTNAATAELRDRVRRRLRAAVLAFSDHPQPDPQLIQMVAASSDPERDRHRLIDALRGLDQSAIQTIHGFCQRVLSEYAFESGIPFELELLPEIRQLLAEVVDDYWAREVYLADDVFVRHLEKTNLSRRWLVELASKVVANPDMDVILPPSEPTPEGDLAGYKERYFQAHSAAQEVWGEHRGTVVKLLLNGNLNGTKYKTTSIPNWCIEMDLLLRDPLAGVNGIFKHFNKFTPTALAESVKKGKSAPSHEFFNRCERLGDALDQLSAELERQRIGMVSRFIPYVRQELANRKLKARRQSFDDLLHRLRAALRGPAGNALAANVRRRYPAVLVDEFQDTDPGQYEVLRRIWSDPNAALFLVGDPKQAIYAFRGADVFAYLAAARDTANSSYTLTTNYRSDPGLVRALNTLYGRLSAPFLISEIRYAQVMARPEAQDRLHRAGHALPGLEFLFVPASGRSGRRDDQVIPKRRAGILLEEGIAGTVVALLQSGAVLGDRALEPGDLAVLTRTNAEAAALHRALQRAGVDSVLQGDSSVLDAPEAQEVSWLLRAMSEPGRASTVRIALATRVLGVSATQLEAMRDTAREWELWIDHFREWRVRWEQRGISHALRQLFHDQHVAPRLLAQRGGERALTNLLHLAELLHEAESREQLGMAGLLQWLDEARHDPAARDQVAREAVQVRLESDTKKLKVTTIHQSKGLEYGIVFLPYLWNNVSLRDSQKRLLTYHDPAEGHSLKLDLRPANSKEREVELAEHEALGEALRLAYVALTRARHQVVVVFGGFQAYSGSSLAWLLHHPDTAPGSIHHTPGQRLHDANEQLLLDDVQKLAALCPQEINVTRLASAPIQQAETARTIAPSIQARSVSHALHARHRISSFSALTSGEERLTDPPLSGADHTDAPMPPDTTPEVEAPPIELNDFPRGPGPGNLLHAVLERWDFQEDSGESRRAVMKEELLRHGVPADPWTEQASRALEAMLATPLTDQGLRLSDIPATSRVSELEFIFPVSQRTEPARDHWLTAHRLAEVFRRWGQPPLSTQYADRLCKLDFLPLSGFLRGFIDLVFEGAGKYYVVDWKSNHLGAHIDDYGESRLLNIMMNEHYILQYHIYIMALHRHLARRLPGYCYERNLGGAFYIFLRGVGLVEGSRRGIFFDRPPFPLIDALSRVFDSPQGSEQTA